MSRKDADSERLSAYLDGELSPDETAEVRALLQRDAAARRRLEELRRTARLVSALPRARVSDEFARRLSDRLERDALLGSTDATRTGGPWTARWVHGLATAAALGLIFVTGWLLWPQWPVRPPADLTAMRQAKTQPAEERVAMGERPPSPDSLLSPLRMEDRSQERTFAGGGDGDGALPRSRSLAKSEAAPSGEIVERFSGLAGSATALSAISAVESRGPTREFVIDAEGPDKTRITGRLNALARKRNWQVAPPALPGARRDALLADSDQGEVVPLAPDGDRRGVYAPSPSDLRLKMVRRELPHFIAALGRITQRNDAAAMAANESALQPPKSEDDETPIQRRPYPGAPGPTTSMPTTLAASAPAPSEEWIEVVVRFRGSRPPGPTSGPRAITLTTSMPAAHEPPEAAIGGQATTRESDGPEQR